MLSDYFAHQAYKGTLRLRLDDTNPSKEKEEFQDAIIEDLALMGIRPDKVSYTSDYFDYLYDMCLRLIKEGHAYADDTDQETMRDERGKGIPSKRRDRTVEETLGIFDEMKQGTPEGLKNCIRAKISFDNPNKALRDPVIYRCNVQVPHHRTGTTWKIYPTYDLACPIVDSYEGVTHALRSTEYTDRNPLFQWFLDTLKLRQVYMWDFARMNFIRTYVSPPHDGRTRRSFLYAQLTLPLLGSYPNASWQSWWIPARCGDGTTLGCPLFEAYDAVA